MAELVKAGVIKAGLDQQAVIAGITELLPVFRQRAQEAEDGRVVPAESVKALAETGFFRLLQPASFGGLEADPVTFFTAVRLIASACGSTGWVASVVGVHPWQLALFPPQAQQDVWGVDPATRMSSSYAPTGQAKQVVSAEAGGGYRLDGRWSFSSGCDHASWVLLGGIVTNEEGQPVDFCTFLLPASDYVIDDVLGHGRAARHGQQRHRGGRRLRPRAQVAELHERHPMRLPGAAGQ